jgi:hypothetical protein
MLIKEWRNGAMGRKLGTERSVERTLKDTFTTSDSRDERNRNNTQKIQNDIV